MLNLIIHYCCLTVQISAVCAFLKLPPCCPLQIFTKTPISTFLVRDSAEFPMDTVAEEKEDVNEEVLIQPSVDELDEKESDEIWSKMQTVVTKTVKRGHLATEGEKVPADEDKSGGRQSKKKKKHTKPQ